MHYSTGTIGIHTSIIPDTGTIGWSTDDGTTSVAISSCAKRFTGTKTATGTVQPALYRETRTAVLFYFSVRGRR